VGLRPAKDAFVKRSTAIRHLVEMAEHADERVAPGDTIPWPLAECWVAGDLLTEATSVDSSAILLRLDLPADAVPWLCIHPQGEAIGDALRLGKRPFSWWYRSVDDPPWNLEHRRVVRFWSRTSRAESSTIDLLGSGRVEEIDVPEPTPSEFDAQLQRDLTRSRRHLREAVARFDDRDWRREHRPPEEHLWRAAAALCAIEDAIAIRHRS
jgi:hypothetical protein